ncbi:anti-sigma factor [Stappia indica]|uniref:anti-sigma factor n=1 Tax=Stappia indica TaxID=538381 RepID=UPI001D1962C3|nr:anti-sigma factor [Stappia indica]MCC4244040.1 anti-sigma factor [Stappia indica]
MTQRPLEERIDEVVLGLASEAEHAEIEALAAADPQVAARLERARARFGELDATADEVPLPEGLWNRVAARLDEAPTAPAASHGNVVPLSAKARGRTDTDTRWRFAALASLAASLVLAVALGWSLLTMPQPTVVAVLLDAGGKPVALVEGAADNTTWITLLDGAAVPQGQVMQVWTKPTEEGPPVSLGLLPSGTGTRLSVEGLPPPRRDQLYEITFEPAGGSPTNLPTGPIHGKGLAQQPI